MTVIALSLFAEYAEDRHYYRRQCSPEGAAGCGKCPACKRNRQKANAKPQSEKPYLGPIPFAVQFPEPKWMRIAHGKHNPGQYAEATYTGLGEKFPPTWSEKK